MNTELTFDLMRSISESVKNGNPFADKRSFKIPGMKGETELTVAQQERVLRKSLQAFMLAQTPDEKKSGKIQAFSGSSDLPVLEKDVFNVTMQVPNFDRNWQAAFKGIQLSKGQLDWEIATVDTGVKFRIVPEGQKVEFASIGGEKISVGIEKYGAGLAITWETIEGRKLYKFVDALEDVRAKLNNIWAEVHYGLLAAGGLNNQVAWQGTGSTLDRDIATLQKGADDCGEANKDKGYGDTAQARFLLFASPKYRNRINQALRVTSADLAKRSGDGTDKTPGQIVDANIEPIYTYNSAIPTGKALLVLPGNKIQNSIYMANMGFSRQDIYSLTEERSYWTAFGAGLGDTDQTFELALS